MHLKGWAKPLPQWIVDAIQEGKLIVWYDEKNDCELLKGEVMNPWGIIVSFQQPVGRESAWRVFCLSEVAQPNLNNKKNDCTKKTPHRRFFGFDKFFITYKTYMVLT